MKVKVPCKTCISFAICKNNLLLFGGKRRILDLRESCPTIRNIQPIVILSYFENMFFNTRKLNAA
jgi:hypothetical protein